MDLNIALLVFASAVLHPFWNLLVKKNPDPQFGYMCMTFVLAAISLVHGLIANVDFSAALNVLPLIALSIVGQLIYGNCLTAVLKRGDISVYYPIIRASPVFIVIVSLLFLGKTYSLFLLLGISLAVIGVFLLLYRRGTHFLEDPRTFGLALLAMSGTGIYSLADAFLMNSIAPQVLVFAIEVIVAPIYAIIWLRRRSEKQLPRLKINLSQLRYLILPVLICYASYFLILLAYQLGGEVAAVTSIRQASIPVSVALGGLFLREGAIARRFLATGILTLGIIVIVQYG